MGNGDVNRRAVKLGAGQHRLSRFVVSGFNILKAELFADTCAVCFRKGFFAANLPARNSIFLLSDSNVKRAYSASVNILCGNLACRLSMFSILCSSTMSIPIPKIM